MKHTLSLLAACLIAGTVHAGNEPYAVSSIPASLLEKAHAVKRTEEIRYEVSGPGDARLYRHWVITILDEAGADAADLTEFYNKMIRISSLNGTLYDAEGKVLQRLKSRDVIDQSAVSGNNLMDDSRVKHFAFDYTGYPYTVEFEVEQKYNTTFFQPHWAPQNDEHLSVQKSIFTYASVPGYAYRYKAFQYKGEPEQHTGKYLERTWTIQNLPALEQPFAAPLWHEMTPTVFFAPNRFSIDNFEGSSEEWSGLGQFLLTLNKGRDELPPTLKQKVHELADGISDPREKVRRLYQFLQQNTRYISIQMGIGGWQTFEARYVAEKGYGDCKALSNYMYSLLKEAGIPSLYTVIHAGRNANDRSMLEDFPSNQFNHAILCVPLQKDSMWLECTSQLTPAGYMGSFTGNRKALVVTPDGGKLVATPRYTYRDNLQQRKATGTVNAEGHLDVQVRTLFRAEQQDELSQVVQILSRDKVKKYLDEHLGLPTYEVTDFRYEQRPGSIPELLENLTLYIPGFANVSGKRLFVTPNFINHSNTRLTEETRTLPIHLRQSYSDVDSIELTLPEGYEVEALPKPVQLQTAYGNYSIECKIAGNKLLYVRHQDSWPATLTATEWDKLKEFYNAVYKGDRASVVLVKK
jgi:transglutaminase-like putative cysteine protease